MASFQSNIGWKSMRKRENKYYRSVPFRSQHVIENSKEIAQKCQKIIVKPIWRHFLPKQVGHG